MSILNSIVCDGTFIKFQLVGARRRKDRVFEFGITSGEEQPGFEVKHINDYIG